MPTSAEIVLEFIRGRAELLDLVRKKVTDPYRAPEMRPVIARTLVLEAMDDVSDEERIALDRMRGNGPVDWQDVSDAFKEQP